MKLNPKYWVIIRHVRALIYILPAVRRITNIWHCYDAEFIFEKMSKEEHDTYHRIFIGEL